MRSRPGSQTYGKPLVALAVAVAAFWWLVLADSVWWFHTFPKPPMPADFQLYFDAARIGLAHGWNHIYDLTLQRTEFYQIRPQADVFDSAVFYVTPPPMAWLIAPFAILPYPVAYWAWFAFLTAAYAATAWFATPGRTMGRVAIVLGGATTYPVLICLAMGQVSLLIGVAVVAAWALLRRGHDVWAGLALSLIVLKPQVAYVVPVALLVWGAWRPVAVATVAGALLAAASALSLGGTGLADWMHALSLESVKLDNQVWTPAVLVGVGPLASAIEVAAAVLAVAVAWLARGRADAGTAIVAGLLASILAAPYHHGADSFGLVAAALIALNLRPSRLTTVWLVFGAIAAFVEPPTGPAPLLLFAAGGLLIMGFQLTLDRRVKIHLGQIEVVSPEPASGAAPSTGVIVVDAQYAQKEAGEHSLHAKRQ